MADDLLNTKQAAELTGFRHGSLCQMRKRGRGPRFVKLGPKAWVVRYHRSELERWMADPAGRRLCAVEIAAREVEIRSLRDSGSGYAEIKRQTGAMHGAIAKALSFDRPVKRRPHVPEATRSAALAYAVIHGYDAAAAKFNVARRALFNWKKVHSLSAPSSPRDIENTAQMPGA